MFSEFWVHHHLIRTTAHYFGEELTTSWIFTDGSSKDFCLWTALWYLFYVCLKKNQLNFCMVDGWYSQYSYGDQTKLRNQLYRVTLRSSCQYFREALHTYFTSCIRNIFEKYFSQISFQSRYFTATPPQLTFHSFCANISQAPQLLVCQYYMWHNFAGQRYFTEASHIEAAKKSWAENHRRNQKFFAGADCWLHCLRRASVNQW